PQDVASGQVGNGTAPVVPSVTTTAADDLHIGVIQTWNTNSVTLPGALTSRMNFGSNGSSCAAGDRDQAVAGATGSFTGSLGQNSNWNTHALTFKQAAGGNGRMALLEARLGVTALGAVPRGRTGTGAGPLGKTDLTAS